MDSEELVGRAVALHGHLAPGIALGIRMSLEAMERLGARKGEKKLIAVSETARCLADAMQVTTGCTMGHGNAFVEDYGKLAITLARVDTKRGVRVALRRDAHGLSPLMRRWMLREGRLTKEEEVALAEELLRLDGRYLDVEEIEIQMPPKFENTRILACERCGDLIPEAFAVREEKTYCKRCMGLEYYQPAAISPTPRHPQ